jgi:alpha-L-fucosidase
VRPVPTPDQANYQHLEKLAFLHFGPNTFTGAEVGDGNASPDVFNPSALDANQWMAVVKSASFRLAMLTAKHHDGFCLWPTKCSAYNVSASPWKGGQGDVVKEFTDAARAAGIKAGLYLSPFDTHAADSSGAPDYFAKFQCMLTELLTSYGDITEVWFDGNTAPQGDWNAVVALVRKLQPHAVIQMGPEIAVGNADIRWVGSESGMAPAGTAAVQTRNGVRVWYPAECDVSIRPGWFHHASEDTQLKPLATLLDIYFNSVGHNCPLLLNVPPDQRGLIAEPDVARMQELGTALTDIFRTNLAKGQAATADSVFAGAPAFAAGRAVDGSIATYWAAADGMTTGRLELDLGGPTAVSVVSLKEPLELGERTTRYHVELQAAGATDWTTVGAGTTIGTRSLHRLPAGSSAQKVAVVIEQARAAPAIAELAVY